MRPPEPIAAPSTIWTTPILRLLARPFRGRSTVLPIAEPEPAAPNDPIPEPTPTEESEPTPPIPPKRKREAARKKRKPLPEPAPATWIMVAPGRYIRAEEPPVAPEVPEALPVMEEPPTPDLDPPAIISAETSGPL